jgi:hypothetical protein
MKPDALLATPEPRQCVGFCLAPGKPSYSEKRTIHEHINWLGQQPDSSFTPNLAMLDALIQSLDVR